MKKVQNKENLKTQIHLPPIRFKSLYLNGQSHHIHLFQKKLPNYAEITSTTNQRYNFNNQQLISNKSSKNKCQPHSKVKKQLKPKKKLDQTNNWNQTILKDTFIENLIRSNKEKSLKSNKNKANLQQTDEFLEKSITFYPPMLTTKQLNGKQRLRTFESQNINLECFEGIFPIARYGCSLNALDGNIYLFGGYSYKGSQDLLYFHSFNLKRQKWSQIIYTGDQPIISPCYHTAQIFKSYILFIGGLSINILKNKRFYNNSIQAYNINKNQWDSIRFNVGLRSHSTTLFGNTLVIYGGINQKQQYSNSIYFLVLNYNNIYTPLTVSWQMPIQCPLGQYSGIAYHKLVNTYDMDLTIKNKIKLQGLLLFGGVDRQGKMNNHVKYFEAAHQFSQGDTKYKKWQTLQIRGQPPCPRTLHSMNLIKSKGYVVIVGGKDKQGNNINDIWMIELRQLTWIQVSLSSSLQFLQDGISSHCTTSIGSKIFIYGGNPDQNINNTFWSIQTDISPYSCKKAKVTNFIENQQSASSIRSIEQNQKK